MADIQETATWEPLIHEIGTDENVMGGPDGVDNLPHRQLADRTAYLKALLDTVEAELQGKAPLSHAHDASAITTGFLIRRGSQFFHPRNRYHPPVVWRI